MNKLVKVFVLTETYQPIYGDGYTIIKGIRFDEQEAQNWVDEMNSKTKSKWRYDFEEFERELEV